MLPCAKITVIINYVYNDDQKKNDDDDGDYENGNTDTDTQRSTFNELPSGKWKRI